MSVPETMETLQKLSYHIVNQWNYANLCKLAEHYADRSTNKKTNFLLDVHQWIGEQRRREYMLFQPRHWKMAEMDGMGIWRIYYIFIETSGNNKTISGCVNSWLHKTFSRTSSSRQAWSGWNYQANCAVNGVIAANADRCVTLETAMYACWRWFGLRTPGRLRAFQLPLGSLGRRP